MTIEISQIRRVFRYNGVELPDVPGMTPREIRDLYSDQHPELVSAEVEGGEVVNGTQEYTFRKAVGTKGRTDQKGERLAALKAAVDLESRGETGAGGKLARTLGRRGTNERSSAWGAFVLRSMRDAHERGADRVMPTSDMLAPLP